MGQRSLVGWVALIGGAGFFLVTGAWAFLEPRSFFENVARWDPYNEHFLHDVGAFQIGIGVALLVSFKEARGSVVALAGAAGAALFHALSHFMDSGEGGRATDPISLTVFAVLLLAGLWFEWRRAPRQ